MKFFGKIDHNQHGNISSQKPAWAMQTLVEDLEENINAKRIALELGHVPYDSIPGTKEELKKAEAKLRQILESRPQFKENEENSIHKMCKEMSEKIQETMFTRSEMKMGTVDAHEEARRMVDPIVKLTKEQADLAKENNIKVFEKPGGLYASRDGATQLWKLIRYYFGENANVETLRKDKATSLTGA